MHVEIATENCCFEARVCFTDGNVIWKNHMMNGSLEYSPSSCNGQPERLSKNTLVESTDNEATSDYNGDDDDFDGRVSDDLPLVVPSVANVADLNHCRTIATGSNIVPAAIPATREPMSPVDSIDTSSSPMIRSSSATPSTPLPVPSPGWDSIGENVHPVDVVVDDDDDDDGRDQDEDHSPGQPLSDATMSTPSEFDTDDSTPSDITNAGTISDSFEDFALVTKKRKLDTSAKQN